MKKIPEKGDWNILRKSFDDIYDHLLKSPGYIPKERIRVKLLLSYISSYYLLIFIVSNLHIILFMKIKAISFDLWFTLIWSDNTLLEEYTSKRVNALYKSLKKYKSQVSYDEVEKLYSYTSHFRMIVPPRETVKYIVYGAGLDLDHRIIDHIWRMYERSTYSVKPHLNPESIETLEYLREKGFKIGIVSNTSFSEDGLQKILENIGLSEYFDVVLSSASIGIEKPLPEIFDILVQKLDVDRCSIIHIGDKYLDDVVGAYLAGLKGILYRGLWDKYKVYKEFRNEELLEFCPRQCIIIDDLRMIKEILRSNL